MPTSSSHADTSTPLADEWSAHDMCEAAVTYVLQHVNTIQYLIQSIEGVTQRPFARERIKCLPAVPKSKGEGKSSRGGYLYDALNSDRVLAGYMWRRARPDCEQGDIVLIEDHMTRLVGKDSVKGDAVTSSSSKWIEGSLTSTQTSLAHEAERNIRHELIHAFDDARGFVESSDCTHQACSEVRAARLSGDCFAREELRRGRFNYWQGGMQCVRRRAIMAVELNPVCRGFSERAVERVFQRCYSDYEPYAAPIYALGSYGDCQFENASLKL